MDEFFSWKNVTQLLLDGVPDEIHRVTLFAHIRFIEACCQNKRLDVTGTQPNSGKGVEISSIDWRHLRIDTLSGNVDAWDDDKWLGKSYTDLRWSQHQIQAIVPDFHKWIARSWLSIVSSERHEFSDETVEWLKDISKGNLRSLLITLANDGKSSTKVEALASKLGLSALASKPDHTKHDPMTIAGWSLPMTIAWIVWLTPSAVREQEYKFREESLDWRSLGEGETLAEIESASIDRLRLGEAYDKAEGTEAGKAQSMSIDEACESLMQNLGNGSIKAKGRRYTDKEFVKIPKLEWTHLSFDENANGADVVVNRNDLSKTVYSEITLYQNEVVEQYKEIVEPKQPKKPLISSPKLREEVTSWYVNDYVPQNKGKLPTPTHDDDVVAAKAKFGKNRYCGAKFLKKVRAESAPAEWIKRGPKKNNK